MAIETATIWKDLVPVFASLVTGGLLLLGNWLMLSRTSEKERLDRQTQERNRVYELKKELYLNAMEHLEKMLEAFTKFTSQPLSIKEDPWAQHRESYNAIFSKLQCVADADLCEALLEFNKAFVLKHIEFVQLRANIQAGLKDVAHLKQLDVIEMAKPAYLKLRVYPVKGCSEWRQPGRQG